MGGDTLVAIAPLTEKFPNRNLESSCVKLFSSITLPDSTVSQRNKFKEEEHILESGALITARVENPCQFERAICHHLPTYVRVGKCSHISKRLEVQSFKTLWKGSEYP